MFSKKAKMTSLITFTLIVGLMVTSFVGLAGNGKEISSEETGIMEETYINLLAPRLGLEAGELNTIMENAREKAAASNHRPISETYLEILTSELEMDLDELKKKMTNTRVEAAEKLASEGTISQEFADSFKERTSTFPFGYSNQGADRGRSQAKDKRGTPQGSANQYGTNDGDRYGPGDGECDGNGPHGNKTSDNDKRGQGNGRRGRN
ncbi:hypothetical protein KGY79_03310 [Candidatus Bipolaricaulota bacterium]|nr:hypothetical protein [Candidatus Bipolaricaulota bacterium]